MASTDAYSRVLGWWAYYEDSDGLVRGTPVVCWDKNDYGARKPFVHLHGQTREFGDWDGDLYIHYRGRQWDLEDDDAFLTMENAKRRAQENAVTDNVSDAQAPANCRARAAKSPTYTLLEVVERAEAKVRKDAAIAEKAANHVDWLLGTLRPLLIDQFLHGYKHGVASCCEVCPTPEASEL